MSYDHFISTALSTINAYSFEKVCRKIIEFKWESTGLRFPSEHAGGDGGNDAWDTYHRRKYAFSIQKNWKEKVLDEFSKLKDYNGDDLNKRNGLQLVELYYLTNQDISTKNINNFIKKYAATFESYSINIFALNELSLISGNYLKNRDNYDFYDLLGVSGLIIPDRKSNLYGLPNPEAYADPEIIYDKQFLVENRGGYTPCLEQHLSEIFFGAIDQDIQKHYLIEADAGMGKSFEMERTVSLICQNNVKNRVHKKIKAYFFDLKTYVEDIPWDTFPAIPQERLYVFLDGWDELSFNKQSELHKYIQASLHTRPRTYFVISGRTGAFRDTRLNDIFKELIKYYITLPAQGNLLWEEPIDMRIPFFKELSHNLEQNVLSIPELLHKWFDKEFIKRQEKDSKKKDSRESLAYKQMLEQIGEFALRLFNDEVNSFTDDDLMNLDESLEEVIKAGAWVSVDLSNPPRYYFRHKIFQEYLIALYFSNSQDIPSDFCAGYEKQIIKKKYSNIFYLWLSIISRNKGEIYDKALSLAKQPKNILLLLSCDHSYIEENVRIEVCNILLNNLNEINFKYPDIAKIAHWINTLSENERQKIVNDIYDITCNKLEGFQVKTEDLELLTGILVDVIKKPPIIITEDQARPLVHQVFRVYTSFKNSELSSLISFTNTIAKAAINNFKIDQEFESYCTKHDIPNKEYYLKDFLVFRIVDNFMKEPPTASLESIIDKHKDELISILPLLAESENNGSFKVENITSDNEYTPVVSLGDSLRSPYYLSLVIKTKLEIYHKKILPDAIEQFIFEGFICLFKNFYQKGAHLLAGNDMYNLILSSSQKFLFDKELSSDRYSILRNHILSDKITHIEYGWNDYILPIVKNAPVEEKDNWIDGVLLYLNDSNFNISVDILFAAVDFKNITKVSNLLSQLKQSNTKSWIFSSMLDKYYHSESDIPEVWQQEYHTLFDKRDKKMKESEDAIELLKKKSNQHEDELKVLFDQDLFKDELKKIVLFKEDLDLSYYDLTFNNIHSKLSTWFSDDHSDLKKQLLENYQNQILISFLWRYWEGFNRASFESLQDSDWHRIRLICISDIIGDISLYGDTIGDDPIDYFKQKNRENNNPKKEFLKTRMSEIAETVKMTYISDTPHKINILLWLTLEEFYIYFPQNFVHLYLECPSLRMWSHPLKSNPYWTLQLIIKSSEHILRCCKKNLLAHPIKPNRRWEFYMAYLRLFLTNNDTDRTKILARGKEITDTALADYWDHAQAIKTERNYPFINLTFF